MRSRSRLWILMALFAVVVLDTVVRMVVHHDTRALVLGAIVLVILVPVLVRDLRHRNDIADVARGR